LPTELIMATRPLINYTSHVHIMRLDLMVNLFAIVTLIDTLKLLTLFKYTH
jgi:hypothetical protein